jgi:L-aspartate oxidase
MKDVVSTDVLVLGAGLAGSIAALRAAESGSRVLLVEAEAESASSWAQGGIVYSSAEAVEDLAHDIFEAGCRINNPSAVRVVSQEGPRILNEWLLAKCRVPFDTREGGEFDLTLEAAHSRARILHVKDHTGASIMDVISAAVRADTRIERLNGLLVDLMVSDRHDARSAAEYRTSTCAGAYVFVPASGQVLAVVAKAVILATGGFSRLFEHSTGPRGSRGDGISAAHRAGARTLHLEYVQFHPTALFVPGQPRYLLTEALRGSGARLLNAERKSFVDELAPRDVVARAIHEEMLHSGTEHVWLDVSAVQEFATRFPRIQELLAHHGFDPSRDLIPVVPAAHYTIGGVWTDLDGASSLPGLFAAGEVACTGLHGANRLASTSLLEALVFAHRAADAACRLAAENRDPDFEPKPWIPASVAVDPALLQQDWALLRRTMWNYVGLVRSPARLKRAERMLSDLRRDVEDFYQRGALSEALIGLRHAVLVATLVLYAALRNPQSLGTHFLRYEES